MNDVKLSFTLLVALNVTEHQVKELLPNGAKYGADVNFKELPYGDVKEMVFTYHTYHEDGEIASLGFQVLQNCFKALLHLKAIPQKRKKTDGYEFAA